MIKKEHKFAVSISVGLSDLEMDSLAKDLRKQYGLPTDDMVNEYVANSLRESVETIIRLSMDKGTVVKAEVLK